MRSAVAPWCNSWWAQVLQNRLITLVLVMIVIVPLVAAPTESAMVDGYSLAGTAALVFEGFALLLLVTLLWGSQWDLRRERVLTFLRTGINLPVLLLMALAVLSCILSLHKMFSVQEISKLSAGVLLYFVVFTQFRRPEHLSLLVDALLFLAICASFIVMAQYQVHPEVRASALFGNPQPLGSLLMILLPIITSIAMTKQGTRRQLPAQVATMMTAGCLLLTQTRSAWMGAIASFVVLVLLSCLRLWQRQRMSIGRSAKPPNLAARKHKLVLPFMLAAIPITFALLTQTQNTHLMERASTLVNLAGDASWQGRQQQWAGTIAMIKSRPLTGWGIGQFPLYQYYYTGQGEPLTGGAGYVSLSENAHNFYLQTAAELGLPGLLLWLTVPASFLIAGLQRVRKMHSGMRCSLLMGSMAATVAFLVDAISSPSWQFGHIAMFFWLTLGIGTSCLQPRSGQQQETSVAAYVPAPRLVRPLSLLAASLALLLIVLPTAQVSAQANYKDEGRDRGQVISITLLLASLIHYYWRGYDDWQPEVTIEQIMTDQP